MPIGAANIDHASGWSFTVRTADKGETTLDFERFRRNGRNEMAATFRDILWALRHRIAAKTLISRYESLRVFNQFLDYLEAVGLRITGLKQVDENVLRRFAEWLRLHCTGCEDTRHRWFGGTTKLLRFGSRLFPHDMHEDVRRGLFPSNPIPASTRNRPHAGAYSKNEKESIIQATARDVLVMLAGSWQGEDSDVPVLSLLLLDFRSGRNETPLLEMTRESLAVPSPDRRYDVLVTNKRRGYSTRQQFFLKDEEGASNGLPGFLSVGTLLNMLRDRAIRLSPEARPEDRECLFLYRTTRQNGEAGEVRCLTGIVARARLDALSKRHRLRDKCGRSLKIRFPRIRKRVAEDFYRISGRNIIETAILLGNDPETAYQNYLAEDSDKKRDLNSLLCDMQRTRTGQSSEAPGAISDQAVAEVGSNATPTVVDNEPTDDVVPIRLASDLLMSRRAVSWVVRRDGTRRDISLFGDPVWDLSPFLPRESMKASAKRIRWGVQFAIGGSLLDPEFSALLAGAKAFVYSLMYEPIDRRGRPSAGTIIAKFNTGLVCLLRWMVCRGFRAFNEIDDFDDYVAFASVNSPRGKCLQPKTIWDRLKIVEDLWAQRSKLSDGLARNPWLDDTAGTLSGFFERRASQGIRTKRIPDETAAVLARKATAYVEQFGHNIITARIKAESARREALRAGRKSTFARERAAEAAKKLGYDSLVQLQREEGRLRTACYLLILLLSGARSAEVLSIELGCVSHEVLDDGTRLMWLWGIVYKKVGDPEGRRCKWMIPPIVERAVSVLERLTAPARKELQTTSAALANRLKDVKLEATERVELTQRLDSVKRQSRKLFLGHIDCRKRPAPVTYGSMDANLKMFARHCDARQENGDVWNLHAHQFRRTFACFVARHRLGDIFSLNLQFQHWTLDETAYYMDGAVDYDLLDEIASARQEITRLALREKPERQDSVVRTMGAEDDPDR